MTSITETPPTTPTTIISPISMITSTPIMDLNDTSSVRAFALIHCKEYLGGVWKTIKNSQFQIDKISGGLSNYLYLCSIRSTTESNQINTNNNVNKVLLRLYGENHHINSSIMLKDVVVSAIMSDKGFGPKLYGIFPQGRLEEYIQSEQLCALELPNERTSEKIAKILAEFHSLEMPFMKEPKWLFDTIQRYLNSIDKEISTGNNHFNHNKEESKKLKKLLSYNLNGEFKELKDVLESLDSPVVFCHNDLQPGNILKLSNENMLVIDYEYGSYNYRGFDLGNYFCEWMMNNNYEHYPYFTCKQEQYPSREQQLYFIRSYLKEYKRLTSSRLVGNYNDNLFNEEQLLEEANYFALASHFFWSVWSIVQAATTKIKFSYLDYGLARMKLYHVFKRKLMNNTPKPKIL